MVSPRGPVTARWADVLAGLSFLLVLMVLLVLAGRPLATDDLWWHMKLGEVYAELGPWVSADPLYHTTSDRPTVPHEWLYQIGVHGLERMLGFQGLRGVHVLAIAAIALWALRIFRRTGGGLAPACLAAVVFLELSWFRLFQFRPDLVSVAALLALYELLLAREAPPGRARTVSACGVFLLWVNMHSLFAVGLALLLAALLGLALQRALMHTAARSGNGSRADAKLALGLSLALGLALLVTLANPRGIAAHTLFFVESASGDIWQLQDDFLPWNPFRPSQDNRALTPLCWTLANALLAAFTWVAGRGVVRVLRERSPEAVRDLDSMGLGLSLAAFAAMLVTVRFHWLSLFPLLYLLRAFRRRNDAAPDPLSRGGVAAVASFGLALVFPGGIHVDSYAREVAVEPAGYWSPYLDQRYCGPGVRFLADAGLKGRLFHPFNLGGYLGFWLAPDLRTFIDGRMDHYPSDVLRDYLRIRHASQEGAGPLLWKLLEEREIDVFFGTSFPESRYSDRFWTAHVRRLPGWLPIWTSQTHSIYLRRSPRNARNLTLAKAWYMQRRIPFSYETGVDMGAAIARRPAWVVKQGVVPPDYADWVRESHDPDPQRRRVALARLGQIYWLIGAFEMQVEADAEVVRLDPGAKQARRRLADGLLALGRAPEAVRVARALHDEDPDYQDIRLILALARSAELEQEADAGAAPKP
jgi:hypothetical protein